MLEIKPTVSLPWKNQPTSSLSPPPRRSKSKRESTVSRKNSQPNDNANSRCGRRPLLDPTLTPRVKPRSIKTKKQPSLLRLSLDAELIQHMSPDAVSQDNESLYNYKSSHSSASFTPAQPYRSGTLGAIRNPKLSLLTDQDDIPPVPSNIPFTTHSNHDNQSTTATRASNISFTIDSPISFSPVEEDDEKLTLKERRHRKSPLSMPDTEQLTLALENFLTIDKSSSSTRKRQSQQVYSDSTRHEEEEDLVWRQQILEQTLAYSFQTDKSRHEAMLTLEGKNTKPTTTLQPIVNFHELDSHFENDTNDQDVVKEKAQYDAVVSRTTLHRRQLSHDERKSNNNNNHRTSLRARSPTNERKSLEENDTMDASPPQQLGRRITEVVTTTPTSANKSLLFPTLGPHLSVTPQTPPHHKQNAPSLISAPSTPNSIDSSVFDHDDYLIHERNPHLSLIFSST